MKNIRCLLGHKFIKVKDCYTKKFENDTEEICVYYCKKCGKVAAVRTICLKARSKDIFIQK